jgi:cysteine desulfurase
MIYLDWNSYGVIAPSVLNIMSEAWMTWCNPNSKHSFGQDTKRFLLQQTEFLLDILGAMSYQCTFTGSATEANMLVLNQYGKVYVSDVEHPSILECTHAKIIPVDGNGQIRMDYLEEALHRIEPPFLVSYLLANHETGIINNVKAIADLTHRYGGSIHTDATQAFGRIPINLDDLGVDYATICSYKHGGPIGVGALIHRPTGCSTWSSRRGTPPVPIIAGMVASLTVETSSNVYFEELISPLEIVGRNLMRLPNTTCIRCRNRTELLMSLDVHGIMTSSGAACLRQSDRAHSPISMGISGDTVRISSGWSNTKAD